VLALSAGVALGSATRSNAQQAQGLLEIRTYTANPGKLEALVTRMRDGETGLFEKHGMKNVLHAIDAPSNVYIYIVRHESRESADKSWESFRADPKWIALRAASETNGPLVGKVESRFVAPTSFSPLK
jgi:hypothetical protein